MAAVLLWFTRLGDKAGSLGALASAMGCAMCFPAIASLGAALGLGSLSHWEWQFIGTLMPAAAWLVICVSVVGWFAHGQWHRVLLGVVGPTVLLLSLYPWFQYGWSSYATYTGIAMMLAVSVWDLVSPASRRCDDGQCTTPTSDSE